MKAILTLVLSMIAAGRVYAAPDLQAIQDLAKLIQDDVTELTTVDTKVMIPEKKHKDGGRTIMMISLEDLVSTEKDAAPRAQAWIIMACGLAANHNAEQGAGFEIITISLCDPEHLKAYECFTIPIDTARKMQLEMKANRLDIKGAWEVITSALTKVNMKK